MNVYNYSIFMESSSISFSTKIALMASNVNADLVGLPHLSALRHAVHLWVFKNTGWNLIKHTDSFLEVHRPKMHSTTIVYISSY